jgi:hypothetical protein
MTSSTTYRSPNDSVIIGTKELIPGIALISSINEDGTPNYNGGTDLLWDEQQPDLSSGKMIYVDEDGEEWTFDQLVPEQSHATE